MRMRKKISLKRILLICVILFNVVNLKAQKQTVSGTVTSSNDGSPLSGVSVMVQGASSGVTTDDKGNYKLDVPGGKSKIIFSNIGFNSQTININNRSVINFSMSKSNNQLPDVVVIGYGTRSKRDLTTAVSNLGAEQISKTVALSPELLMQGQMSGVQVIGNNGNPGQRPTVRIRGTNTWGISDPLYVIDGIPIKEYGAGVEALSLTGQYNRGNINIMQMIDPNDIESISVLKDASAGAIYGVRAANGVILITTKKGKLGKPQVSYSQRNGIQNVVKKLKLLNTKQYVDYNNALYASNLAASSAGRNVDNYVFDPSDPRYLGNSPTYDWQDAVRNKNAALNNYDVNVSGGTDKLDYLISFGYADLNGTNIYNHTTNYSGSIKLNIKINGYIRAGINYRLATAGHVKNFSKAPVDIAQLPPWQPIHDPNWTNGFAPVINGYDVNGIWTGSKLYGSVTNRNDQGYLSLSTIANSSVRNMGNAYVELEPLKGLKLKGTISIDQFSNGDIGGTPYVASYFQIDGGDPKARGGGNSLGDYENHNIINLNIISEFSANYTKSLGNHNIDILFDASNQQFKANSLNTYTTYTTSTDPNIIGFGGDNQYSSVVSVRNLNALVGFLLRADYNYKHKYLLDLTIRRDGSSRFAPANRWGTFPGVSAGWRLSQESFMKNIKWINDLKLRAGYGTLGNEEVTDLAYLSAINQSPTYAFGNNPAIPGHGFTTTSATIYGLPNPDLRWEKTSTTNIGFDAFLFNSLNLSVEYYDKKTDGILQTLVLPLSAGLITQPQGNVAKVRNSGIELNANYSNHAGRLNFSVGANFTTVRNRVVSLLGGIPQGTIEEGLPMNYIKGYVIDGRFKTDAEVASWMATHKDLNYQNPGVAAGDFYFKDLRGAPGPNDKLYSTKPDGIIDNYDQVYLGKTIPGYYYGFNLNLDFKQFNFSAQFTGVGDVQKVNNTKLSLLNLDAEAAQHTTEALNYWTPTNTNTSLPRLIWGDPASNARFSNFYVENADYVRLANAQLGYTFPGKDLKNILSNLKIYVGCSNLFTITKFKGFDPEDQGNPAPLVLYTGLNLKF
jgi:TonB-linked SusC/RagA family outer membrane protein